MWPSEDSEDEDYNPETNENSNSRSGIEENMSNDSSSSSLFSSSDGTISYSDSEHYSYLEKPFNIISRSKNRVDLFDSVGNYDSGPSNECAITSYRRQRRDVDYKKLHDVSTMNFSFNCQNQLGKFYAAYDVVNMDFF